MDADAFKVSLFSPAEGIQRIVFRIDGGRRMPAETLPASAGLTGYVIRSAQSLLTSREELDALGVETLRPGDPDAPTQSILCAPMAREGRVLGVISTQSYRPNAYDSRRLELFEAIVNQAAIAIENGQLQRRALDLAVIEERNRLARELHDLVTQMLFSITLTLQAGRVLMPRDPVQAELQVDKAQQTAQEALAEMRALIYQLRPASMRERGLGAALTSYIDAYRQRTGLEVTFQHEGEAELSEAQEQAIFRIVQEALNNIVEACRGAAGRGAPGQWAGRGAADGARRRARPAARATRRRRPDLGYPGDARAGRGARRIVHDRRDRGGRRRRRAGAGASAAGGRRPGDGERRLVVSHQSISHQCPVAR